MDTAPIIYILEGHEPFASAFRWFFERAAAGEYEVFASTVTLAEVLVGPSRQGGADLVARYRSVLSSAFQLVPVDASVAARAADVRARYSLRFPDAIQVATAVETSAGYLLTADRDFANVGEVEVVAPQAR